MKGLELPISTIVVIVIVLIVLLAVVALFFGVWNPGRSSISLEAAKNNACQMLISTGCVDSNNIIIRDFDADGDGNYGVDATGTPVDSDDTLLALCQTYYNINIDSECRTQVCHCD